MPNHTNPLDCITELISFIRNNGMEAFAREIIEAVIDRFLGDDDNNGVILSSAGEVDQEELKVALLDLAETTNAQVPMGAADRAGLIPVTILTMIVNKIAEELIEMLKEKFSLSDD